MKKVIERLLMFVNDHGGPSEVARKMGKHPQVFYNFEKRGALPNSQTMLEIKRVLPDLNMEWLYTGVKSAEGYSKELPKGQIESENERLKQQIKSMEQSMNYLKLILSSRLNEEEKKLINFRPALSISTAMPIPLSVWN